MVRPAIHFVCLFALSIGTLLSQPVCGEEPPADAAVGAPTLHLRSEPLPYDHMRREDLPYRLGRELVRQAILIAARDELRLPTRDETLREALPEGGKIIELFPIERANLSGKWRLKLVQHEEGADPHDAEPLWSKTYDYNASGSKMYADMTPKLEADSRGAFLEALEKAGLKSTSMPDANGDRDDASPDAVAALAKTIASIERQLNRVDFIAQFAAVRAAHAAMAQHGETPELLECLVRGYANLGMLTHHQWNSSSEVFTARSWLYAQRGVARSPESERALWNRAYAWALGGVHHHALDDVKAIEALPKSENSHPEWADLIVAFCHGDRDAVADFGDEHDDWKPWAAQLHFHLTDALGHSAWMFHSCQELAQVSPTAYGAYAALAHHGHTLGTTRSGASWAPMAWRQFSAASLIAIPDLPQEVKDVLPTDRAKQAALREQLRDPNPDDMFSPGPNFIASLMREISAEGDDGAPCWSALAFLMEEEQFVQIAQYLEVALDGTEYSLASTVDEILPIVKEHRFASYIDSYRFNYRSEADQVNQAMSALVVEDPRRNMTPMLYRAWSTNTPKFERIGRMLDYNAHRNFTLPGMIEAVSGYRYWNADRTDFIRLLGKELAIIAPHCEIGARIAIQYAEQPTPEQLQGWEDQLREDPLAFQYLGQWHAHQKNIEAAVRCYRRSLDALPTFEATRQLANVYYGEKQFDKWAETLEEFLKSEDLGLQHAQAHQQLANGYIYWGDWARAKPHAVEAAETYSAWGLELASRVCEGLGDWDESEHWIRAMSEGYPSYSGEKWYLWCRRTGRGADVDKALEMAQTFYDVPRTATRETQIDLGIFHILNGNLEAAREAYRQALSFKTTFTCTYMAAQLSQELGDDAARQSVLADMKAHVASQQENPEYDKSVDEVGLAILDVIETGDVSDEQLAKIEKLLEATVSNTRGAFSYFLAVELNALGKTDEARKYWMRALTLPAPDPGYATLSGFQLAKLDGTSRPDGDALDVADLWPQPAPEDLPRLDAEEDKDEAADSAEDSDAADEEPAESKNIE